MRKKPTAHISYHEGLRLIRQFLNYASQHTVEDVQAFTAQWVPCPTWVAMEEVTIPASYITRSADLIESQLGPHGIEVVGGKEWWQWRRPEIPLKAEWIEMKSDAHERKAQGKTKGDRIILYVHGGAYYFGSTGEHRYQMQRHARKLKARLLAPKYRLAPQFPFPCGLHDCIATYLYLIQDHDPSTIILGGDSAGGGMVIAMLVTLRDQNIPLPAGAILLSPWVDLTHSFPSVAGNGDFDYIPPMGFHHKPSMVWPPPNAADLESLKNGGEGIVDSSRPSDSSDRKGKKKQDPADVDAARGYSATKTSSEEPPLSDDSRVPKPGQNLSIDLDGKRIEIQDQIQMYAANHLLAHPLVSPVMQPSLGGLPPLLIQVGGGELLHDEQVYLAHKAANPAKYPPPDAVTREWDPENKILHKYGPTKVQLQVWDDLCHVAHTLSFTRPAKYMYRGVAQFSAWALAHAQDKPMTILDDDDISIISTDSSSEKEEKDTITNVDGVAEPRSVNSVQMRAHTVSTSDGAVGKAGDPLPPFVEHMIRQRVDRHGFLYPLPSASEVPCLQVDRNSIGVIKPGPVRKWISKKSEWDTRFAKEKRRVQKTRLKEMATGYDEFPGETPPPTALAGRRQKGMEIQKQRQGKSWAMAMWSGWGSKHDESTIERKKKFGRRPTQSVILPEAGTGVAATQNPDEVIAKAEGNGELASGTVATEEKPPATFASRTFDEKGTAGAAGVGVAAGAAAGVGVLTAHESEKVEGSKNTYLSANNARPHNGAVAYPFKLRNMPGASVSTATLDSSRDHIRPMGGVGGSDDTDAASSRLRSGSRSREHSPPGGWIDGTNDGRNGGGSEIGDHDWIMGERSKGKKRESNEAGDREVKNEAAAGAIAATAGSAGLSSSQSHNQTEPSASKAHAEDASSPAVDKNGEIGGHDWIMGKKGKGKEKEAVENGSRDIRNGDAGLNAGTAAATAGFAGHSSSQKQNYSEASASKAHAGNTSSPSPDQSHEIGSHDWIMAGRQRTSQDKQKADAAAVSNGGASNGHHAEEASESGKVVQGGEVVSAARPPLNTFVTARESL